MSGTYDTSALSADELALWRGYVGRRPTLALRCGVDNCNEPVGEVHCQQRGANALVVLHWLFGECATTPYRPGIDDEIAAQLADAEGNLLSDIIAARRARADEMTLRWTPDGQRITSRETQPSSVHSLENLAAVHCKVHGGYGPDDQPGLISDVRAKLAETTPGANRRYRVFP